MLLIDDSRCVHRLAALARCDACVRVCPTAAWSLDEAGPGFDADRCDACGLCVTACPTTALALPATPDRPAPGTRPAAGDAGARSVALACGRAGLAQDDPGLLPCVHAVGEAQLLRWQADGVRRLQVYTGACRTCPRGRVLDLGLGLADRLTAVNRVLRSRGAPGMALERLDHWPAQPSDQRPNRPVAAAVDEPVAARRSWLGLARRPAARRPGPDHSAAPERSAWPDRSGVTGALQKLAPPGVMASSKSPEPVVLALWSVALDPARCDACAACARLCPSGAISLVGPAARPEALRLAMAQCTGCGLCVHVCTPGALTLALPASRPAAASRYNLTVLKCQACGKAYRAGLEHPGALPAFCPSCRSVGARRGNRIVQDALPPGPQEGPVPDPAPPLAPA